MLQITFLVSSGKLWRRRRGTSIRFEELECAFDADGKILMSKI
jgi:hypothetical protein